MSLFTDILDRKSDVNGLLSKAAILSASSAGSTYYCLTTSHGH